jgi:hypothetical protein
MSRAVTVPFAVSFAGLLAVACAVAGAISGCGTTTCIVAIECVERCGGPVVSGGCGPCGFGTFDRRTCADAALVDLDSGMGDGGTGDAGGTECVDNGGCGLRPASCCGRCGAATADDYLAAPVSQLAAIGAGICEAEGNPGCPECDSPDDPYLAAVCRSGECVGLDLREEPVTECASPSDCVLAARRCCACGLLQQHEVIAHNPARGGLNEIVCGGDVLCEDPCVPTFASGLAPGCVAGRCVVFGAD